MVCLCARQVVQKIYSISLLQYQGCYLFMSKPGVIERSSGYTLCCCQTRSVFISTPQIPFQHTPKTLQDSCKKLTKHSIASWFHLLFAWWVHLPNYLDRIHFESWAVARQNQQNHTCATQKLRSACTAAQSDHAVFSFRFMGRKRT